jgi:hypothetical protein
MSLESRSRAGQSSYSGWEALQSYRANSVNMGEGEKSEPVDSIMNIKNRHCLSDYQFQELCAINIHMRNIYWATTIAKYQGTQGPQ